MEWINAIRSYFPAKNFESLFRVKIQFGLANTLLGISLK